MIATYFIFMDRDGRYDGIMAFDHHQAHESITRKGFHPVKIVETYQMKIGFVSGLPGRRFFDYRRPIGPKRASKRRRKI